MSLEMWRPPPWMIDALCALVDGDVWFPERGTPSLPAKRICWQCPVEAECLEYALEHNEQWGVWGGRSTRERDKIRRQRQQAAA